MENESTRREDHHINPRLAWMDLFQSKSLYTNLVRLLISMSLVLFIFLAWLIFSISNNYLENVLTRCGKRMSALVDQSIRMSMMSEDHSELTVAIIKVQGIPGVGAIRIYNDEGIIRHSSKGLIAEGTVEKDMTPCTHCHSEVDPAEWGMPETCIYNTERNNGRNMIVLSPILSNPDCRASGCHQSHLESEVLGFLEIELPLNELDQTLTQLLMEYIGLILLFLILIMGALLFFVKRRIHQPLKRIVDASREVSAGNLSVRVNVQPNDLTDIHHVGLALNTMLESINESSRELQQWSSELETKVRTKSEDIARTQNEIYQIERLASLGRLSSSVAHEINNPLAGVLTYAKLVSRILQNPDLNEDKKQSVLKHLDMIQSETTRCGNIVKGLLNFSRDSSQKFNEVHLNEVLAESEQLIKHSFQISDISLNTDFSASKDMIRGNAHQVIQACLAVLTNALEAVSPGPDSQVTYRSYNPDLEHIVIEIKDNGIGISAEDQEHIFEPFFSSKKEMSGIGLGLAVTYGILEQHKAKVTVDSALGAGTSIKFTFELSSGRADDGQ